jgi:hypothetical protein
MKITLPSNKEVEILDEQEYVEKYMNNSRISLPTPNDYENWSLFLLKDGLLLESLNDEDKIFIMNQQYNLYSVWK